MKKILNISFVLLVSVMLLTGCGSKKNKTNEGTTNKEPDNKE